MFNKYLRSIYRRIMCILAIGMLLSGCTIEADILGFRGGEVRGSVLDYQSKIQSLAACAEPQASLVGIDSDGQVSATATMSVGLNDQGEFLFKNIRGRGIQISMDRLNYLIRVDLCGTSYSRPLTGQADQDISVGSGLIEKIGNLGPLATKKISELKTRDLDTLIPLLNKIEGPDLVAVYNTLMADSQLKERFLTTTGIEAENLKYSAPRFVSSSGSDTPFEAQANTYNVSVAHWFDSYSAAYEWTLDNVVVSNNAIYEYVPTKNQQGNHVLKVKVGHKVGGVFDATKPFLVHEFLITTQNNFPPLAPPLTLVGPVYRNTPDIQLEMATGVGKSSCETFTKLALKEGVTSPFLFSEYTLLCSDENIQNLNFSLSPEDGVKTLSLWALDSSNNISTANAANNITVYLDRTSPVLGLTSLPGLFRGAQESQITYTATDATAGLATVKILFAENGVDYLSEIYSGTASSSPQVWTLPSVTAAQARLKIYAIDKAGNESTLVSDPFAIDSTAPDAAALVLVHGSFSNTRSIDLAVTPPGDCYKMFFSESASTPALNDSAWESCAATKTFEVSSPEGLKTIRAWVRDEAGNISPAASVTTTLDQTVPILTMSAPLGGFYKGGTSVPVSWSATDTNLSANPIQIEISDDEGATWTLYSAGVANTGNATWPAPEATNKAGYRLRLTATDKAGNQSRATSEGFAVDSQAPEVTSVIINDGESFAGTALLNLKIAVSDNMTGALKVRTAEAHTVTGSCQNQFADNSWVPWGGSSASIVHFVAPVDGAKKICVWAKDAAGNISVISPEAGAATVNYDEIIYQKGNPPVVTLFTATKNGSDMDLTIQGSDAEGFPETGSYSVSYSTNGSTWLDLGNGLDVSNLANMTWYGDNTGSWTKKHISAPSSVLQYRVILKDNAGNTSLYMKSSIMNAAGWSVFAGSRDSGDGGSGSSVRWYMSTKSQSFAVHPKTNDVYFADESYGIRKYNVKTGTASTFIRSGTNNLNAVSGTLTSSSRVGASLHKLAFDKDGYLYLLTSDLTTTQRIYRFDTTTGAYTKYLGGGMTSSNANPLPADIFLYYSSFAFDEDNSLYVISSCDPLAANQHLNQHRQLLKITQNPETKMAETVSVVWGNCATTVSTIGAIATQTGLYSAHPQLASLSVFGRGRYIYIHEYAVSNTYKIIDGVLRYFDTECRTIYYNAIKNKIVCANISGLYSADAILGAGNEIFTPITNSNPVAECWADGIDATEACTTTDTVIASDSSGNHLFQDGVWENRPRFNRLRIITGDNKVSTLFGTRSFNNGGGTLKKEMISATFRGLHYKKATDPNQGAFPEGLYFMDSTAMVFGRINQDGSNVALWGDQRDSAAVTSGMDIGPNVSMGVSFQNLNGAPLYFDDAGLPWTRTDFNLIQVGADKKAYIRSLNSGIYSRKDEGADPATVGLANSGASNGLIGFGTNFFLFGAGYYQSSDAVSVATDISKILYLKFDFATPANNTTQRIMGKSLISSNPPSAPDSPTTAVGAVKNAEIPNDCSTASSCYHFYDSTTDRLYFTENLKMRYINKASDPAQATLHTLFTSTVGRLYNFTLTPDRSKIWFVNETGRFYCYKLTSTESWCDGVTNHNTITSFVTISRAPNQFAWKDPNTLYISTGAIILEFNPPTGP